MTWTLTREAADPAELQPEHAAWLRLSRWFDDHGATVFWEEHPSELPSGFDEFGRFSMNGTDRPDLLIVGPERTFAVEVKHGHDTSGVHAGVNQTVGYWRDYSRSDLERTYTADGVERDVDAFVLATANSPDGSVYARWYDRALREWPASERFEWFDGEPYWTPEWEFSATETATRVMWDAARRRIEESPDRGPEVFDDDAPGIGVLLSDALDWSSVDRPDEDAPGAFDRASTVGIAPMALYKRPVGSLGTASGFVCHNWRWVA